MYAYQKGITKKSTFIYALEKESMKIRVRKKEKDVKAVGFGLWFITIKLEESAFGKNQ